MSTITASFNLAMTELVKLLPAAATDQAIQATVAHSLVALAQADPGSTPARLAEQVVQLIAGGS